VERLQLPRPLEVLHGPCRAVLQVTSEHVDACVII
jgi:hypothetical protein